MSGPVGPPGTDRPITRGVPDGGPLRMVLATANPHKAGEIRAIMAAEFGAGVELLPRPDDVPEIEETADTFLGNARIKARALVAATGLPSLADDSGLEVDALGGAPGVRSARYAGDRAGDADNVALLLRSLTEVGADLADRRRGQFRAVVVVAYPDGAEVVAEGAVTGTILPAPAGRGGFGYDPVFAPDGGGGRSFAELPPADKHQLSHRGRALRALADALAGTTRNRRAGTSDPTGRLVMRPATDR